MPYIMTTLPPSPLPFPGDGHGPFASMGSLPTRRKQGKLFYGAPVDLDMEPGPHAPPFSLKDNFLSLREAAASITLRRSASESPRHASFSSQNSPRSSQIVLSNGKPLKPSLKSSQSSPILPDDALYARHSRTQSMPAPSPKSVQFREKEAGLESVHTYKVTGRPAALLVTTTSDTETETEPEGHGFPFPIARPIRFLELDPEPSITTPVPSRAISSEAHILLEFLSLPPTRPPMLRGTILVRNVSFEKTIAVRFTLDHWDTVSEVHASYAGPVSTREVIAATAPAPTVGDILGLCALDAEDHAWDRFSFAVRLGDDEARLRVRTLFVALRYRTPAGEWWDNNGGANYRVGFRAVGGAPRVRPRERTTSAPPRRTTTFGASVPAPRVAPQEATGVFATRSTRGWNAARG